MWRLLVTQMKDLSLFIREKIYIFNRDSIWQSQGGHIKINSLPQLNIKFRLKNIDNAAVQITLDKSIA